MCNGLFLRLGLNCASSDLQISSSITLLCRSLFYHVVFVSRIYRTYNISVSLFYSPLKESYHQILYRIHSCLDVKDRLHADYGIVKSNSEVSWPILEYVDATFCLQVVLESSRLPSTSLSCYLVYHHEQCSGLGCVMFICIAKRRI